MTTAAPAPAARECDYCHIIDTKGHHQTVRNVEGQGLVMFSGHFQCCADQPGGCPEPADSPGNCSNILSGSIT